MLELEKNANFYEDTKEDIISSSYPMNHQMETDAYYTNSEDQDIENPQKFMKSEDSGQTIDSRFICFTAALLLLKTKNYKFKIYFFPFQQTTQ